MSKLLPPNSTELERKFADACAPAMDLPVYINTLANIDKAPNEFLSYLAYQYSVDSWENDWSNHAKRALIKDSYNVHKIKGSLKSLRDIVEPFGFTLNIIEWWQTVPQGTAGTFALEIHLNNIELDKKSLIALIELLHATRPLTRHLIYIEVKPSPVSFKLRFASAQQDSTSSVIYPYVHKPKTQISFGGGSIEKHLSMIYPRAS
ncbi:MAG: phage tail protein I [Pseudomonadota bacterium]|nr:phage tail protein I [Pseudomonadota bacterium]